MKRQRTAKPFLPVRTWIGLVLLGILLPAAAVRANPFSRRIAQIKAEIEAAPAEPSNENRLIEILGQWDLVPPREIESAFLDLAKTLQPHPLLAERLRELHSVAMLRRGDLDGTRESYRRRGYVDRWLVLGPFDNEGKQGWDKPFPAETSAVGVLSLAESFPGKERPVHWRPLPAVNPYGYVHLESVLHPNVNACGYALAFVRGEARREVQVWAGGGGSLKVWWNGRLVLEDDAYRQGSPDRQGASVVLEPGQNRVLIKSCTTEDAWGFFFRIADAKGEPLILETSDDPSLSTQPMPRPGRTARLASTLDQIEKRARETPQSADALATLARYLHGTGASDPATHRAHDLAFKAAQMSPTPENCLLWADLAQDPNEARRAIETGLETDPDHPVLLVRLAHLAAKGWDPRRALDALARALDREPDHFPARLMQLRIESQLGLPHTALQKGRLMAGTLPETALVVDTLAFLASRAGVEVEVERQKRRYLAYWYTDADLHFDIADLLANRHESLIVEEHLDAVLDTAPFELDHYLRAAEVYEALGRRDLAEQVIEQASRIAPNEPELWAALGFLRLRAGRPEAGKDALAAALQLKPQDAHLREYLEHLGPGEPGRAARHLVPSGTFLAERGRANGGEHARILADVEVVEVYPNGLGTRTKQTVVEILSLEGAKAWRQFQVTYVPESQRLRIDRAKVYRRDGREAELTGVYTYSVSEPWYRMYYDIVASVLDLPPLEIGDVVEIVYRLDDVAERNMFNDYFGELVTVEGSVSKEVFRYVLITPPDRTFYFNEDMSPSIQRTVETDPDGNVRHLFEWRDVPRIMAEEDMPGPSEAGAVIHVSTYRTWNEVGSWYRGLVRDPMSADEKIRGIVAKLIEGVATDRDKVRAILRWVLKNTRYVALEFGINGYRPYPASLVASRGFGDCKDKANLLVVMLREAGIEADMALVRTRGLGRVASLPASLAVFNHAIVHVPKLDLWLDGTAEHNGTGELPFGDQGSAALCIGQDRIAFVETPVADPARNRFTQQMAVQLFQDGSADCSGTWQIEGENASVWRSRYESEATRNVRFAEDLGDVLPGVKVERLAFENLDDIEKPVRLVYAVHAPRYAQVDGRRMSVMTAPELNLTAGYGRLSSRRYDLEIGPPWESDLALSITLPAGAKVVQTPAPARIASDFGALDLTVEGHDNRLEIRRSFRLSTVRVPRESYQDFRRFCVEVDEALARRILIRLE